MTGTALFRAQHTTINSSIGRSTTETMSDGLQIIGRWPQEPSDTIADASIANKAVNFTS
jgi:hypothetical protein